MARTIAEIYNSMITEKETFFNLNNLSPTSETNPAQSLLTDLTSTSKVAIWRLMFYVVAVAIWIHETICEGLINSAIPSTTPWWNKTIKAFQYGDSLVWNGDKYVYTTISTTKQIITQCAMISSNGILYIKVAKGTTVLSPLAADEATALDAYIQKIMPAGTSYYVINETADILQLAYTIYIDPLKIYYNSDDPADVLNGSLLSDSSVFPVNDAINNYIQFLDIYDFNGKFFVAKLTDVIHAVDGVTNAVAVTVKATYGLVAYTDVLATTSQTYVTYAGYLIIDPIYPLTTAITYLPT